MAPTIVWLQIWRPKFAEKQVKTIFLDGAPKNGLHNLHDNFLVKFGKIWEKMLCTLNNLLAPTPVSMIDIFEAHFPKQQATVL